MPCCILPVAEYNRIRDFQLSMWCLINLSVFSNANVVFDQPVSTTKGGRDSTAISSTTAAFPDKSTNGGTPL